ncbi:uncharacterized protein OCT59_016097 [Rhizophagus irregularis]|uniref:F-box domain-containing protein n=2 Tax=Rhizophagus irregularis TaxID=588596 RepID=A0A015MAM7_RHIIW|nr:hypothetical protein RirG_147960 [Rhizophagus irregularis DAOM 197198w]UZO23766.1 hypothetical protein OCT59_016097 [Rhizophagus irregularis]GBC31002.1 hypothetical protein GLOIN_2v1870025 [Rhizophagus irregularis DAOM 181602=DAOM 197198]CAG8705440.1 1198_t:CDS:1 [Rhizophagus irregularis]
MSKLNKDILFLIFEELKDDKDSLFSSILVNKNWCEVAIPILWKDPWKNLIKERLLLETVVSFLTNESRDYMISHGLNLLIKPDKPPLFNYISFCRYLNLHKLERIIYTIRNIKEEIKWSMISEEIFKLFINKNNRFTHLIIPYGYKRQIQYLSGFEHCFSELESLRCDVKTNQGFLNGLAQVCKSIKKLVVNVRVINKPGIIDLIEAQTKLEDVRFVFDLMTRRIDDILFYRICGKSLVKRANTIRHLQVNNELIPNLSSYVNLISLEIGTHEHNASWNNLENVSLPSLRILKAHKVPTNILVNFIENNKGILLEIKISDISFEVHTKKLIQAIYNNCPNLQYLELIINDDDILELENLLINCRHLDGLILNVFNINTDEMGWDRLFEILIKRASKNLFKFKFIHRTTIKFEALKNFFENWKNRKPMLLHFIEMFHLSSKHLSLIESFKKKGIIKIFYHDKFSYGFDDFEWIKMR